MGDHLDHMQENTVSSLLQLKMLEGTVGKGRILLYLQLTQNIELIIKLVKLTMIKVTMGLVVLVDDHLYLSAKRLYSFRRYLLPRKRQQN